MRISAPGAQGTVDERSRLFYMNSANAAGQRKRAYAKLNSIVVDGWERPRAFTALCRKPLVSADEQTLAATDIASLSAMILRVATSAGVRIVCSHEYQPAKT